MRVRSLLFLLALSVCLVAPAFGEDPPKEEENPPYSMPTENIFTDDELCTKFENRKTKPYGDDTLALVLPCRTSWKWIEVASGAKQDPNRMVPLARAEPCDDPDISVEMKYIQLTREVRLEDWVDFFMDTQGMFCVHGQAGTYHDRKMLDTIAEFKGTDGRLFVARIGFFKNADRIYMIAGSAPKDKYETYSAEFGLAVTSATPLTLSTNAFAEPMREYSFPLGKKLTFTYPASWLVKELSGTPEGVTAVDLYQAEEKKPVGVIKVRVYAKDRIEGIDVQKVTWSVLDEIHDGVPSLQLKDNPLEMEARTEEFPGAGKMVVYQAEIDGAPIEIHELVLDSPETLFSAYLITPPKQKAPMLWMVNRRAWELVGARIRCEH